MGDIRELWIALGLLIAGQSASHYLVGTTKLALLPPIVKVLVAIVGGIVIYIAAVILLWAVFKLVRKSE